MNRLYLVAVPVDLAALGRLAERRALTRRGVLDEGLVLHHLLGEAFGRAALQPFRLLAAPGGLRGTLYAYSRLDAAHLRDIAGTAATPDTLAALSLPDIATKPLPTQAFPPGKTLGFDVLLRPVLRARAGGTTRHAGAERDAFQLAAERRFPDHKSAMSDNGQTREVVYLDWLQTRLGGAARIIPGAAHMVRFQRRRILRGGQLIEGPDAVIHGNLQIADEAAFRVLLEKGVGRHRAYGYGMLLLRPPRKPTARKGG